MSRLYTAIGTMSGTSLDGIDVALITTDGEQIIEMAGTFILPYTADMQARLHEILGKPDHPDVPALSAEITQLHVQAIQQLLTRENLVAGDVDLIGLHGVTLWHAPEQKQTLCVGDGAALAIATGIPVIAELRLTDILLSGRGAPLVPLYHAALAAKLPKPLAFLNIGGISNLTFLGADGLIWASDIGPGNALCNDVLQAVTSQMYDKGGRLAASGTIQFELMQKWLLLLTKPLPHAIERTVLNTIKTEALQLISDNKLTLLDCLATLVALSVALVVFAVPQLPAVPQQWLICGGGRHNQTMLAALKMALAVPVQPVEAFGWQGDFIEAQAWGYLAVRSLLGLPITLPTTTGTPYPATGGRYYPTR